MKKLLSLIILGLLLSGNVYANKIPNLTNSIWKTAQKENKWRNSDFNVEFFENGICKSLDIEKCTWEQNKNRLKFTFNDEAIYNVILVDDTWKGTARNNNANRSWDTYGKAISIQSWGDVAEKPKKQEQSIEFNIKQKKEQCKAIGFKPETEKFADCVLRLVELDVKQQQSNKIAQAKQSGNDALVKQLQRQQYDRGTDALLNLGQQLLNPGTTNSNIYMPQTQRCTIQGFGTFAKMVCR